MSINFMLALVLFVHFYQGGHAYYFSAAGNDAADGRSQGTAWKSLAKLAQAKLVNGDKIFLRGGDVFRGSVSIQGDGLQNILIASNGAEKAVINAGAGNGIFISNTSDVRIENIVVEGDGVAANKGSGILLYTDGKNRKVKNISITGCTVKGFHNYGILIQADNWATSGFENVFIKSCIAEANGEAGIGSIAFYPAISHRNIQVLHCKAFNNRGILTKTANHSGNGIVLSGVDRFNIAYCEAYENGAHCRSTSGGPVGIWAWNATNGIIQHSVSHHNHAGTALHDGGGFDLDGGVSNSVIKNCMSYSNEGAGYLICEFGSGNVFANNLIENNSSTNDGLKNSYGGITIAGAGKDAPVTATIVRNNRITVQMKGVVDGVPAALYFSGTNYKNILVEHNEFILEKGVTAVKMDTLFTDAMASIRKNRFKNKMPEYRMDCSNCNKALIEKWKKKLLTANSVE